MTGVHVLDNYYLSITFLISLALQTVAFLISYTLQFDTITDLFGSLNFLLLSAITLGFSSTHHTRQIVASTFQIIWAIRLGGFLFYRVLKTGGDKRFDEFRNNFIKFGAFWFVQALWAWTCSLPVIILNSPDVSSSGYNPSFGQASDIVGIILWSVGFIIESLADFQKFSFKSRTKDSERQEICNTGIWSLSRHPNYFGEITLWWGIWSLCVTPAIPHVLPSGPRNALLSSVVSPIFIFVILFFLSGMPNDKSVESKWYQGKFAKEGKESRDEGWARWKDYVNKTSIFFPIPQSIYAPLPGSVKKTILLDLPLYHISEKDEERRRLVDNK